MEQGEKIDCIDAIEVGTNEKHVQMLRKLIAHRSLSDIFMYTTSRLFFGSA